MPKNRPEDLPQGWFSRRECCEFCNITVAAFVRSWHERIPDKYRTRPSKDWYYFGRAILDEAVKRNRTELADGDGKTEKKGGADNPIKDLILEEDLKIKRMRRLEIERSLAHLKTLNSNLADAGSILREAGHELRRRHGNDAGEILDDALDEFQDAVNRISDEIEVDVLGDEDAAGDESEKKDDE